MIAKKYFAALAFVLLCVDLTCLPRAEAAEVEGINFDERYMTADTSLELRGTGLLRVMVFAKKDLLDLS
ncbi:MAG: hypothetical protein PVH44_02075, partial [Desulfobacterales bacterium]|jgi:hypothetical protein